VNEILHELSVGAIEHVRGDAEIFPAALTVTNVVALVVPPAPVAVSVYVTDEVRFPEIADESPQETDPIPLSILHVVALVIPVQLSVTGVLYAIGPLLVNVPIVGAGVLRTQAVPFQVSPELQSLMVRSA
jgi:hypothetical protein